MSQSFNCPNCSAPLDYDGGDLTVRCPYCGSSVIAPESLRSAPQVIAPHAPSLPVVGMDALLSQAANLKEVARLIREGNKIEAIKAYRETFDVSLAEAKSAVEKMEAGQPVIMPSGAPASPARSSQSVSHEAFTRAEISRLVQLGNKIEAIKLYREKTGAGLKEAKDAVEAFEAGRPLVFVEPSPMPDLTPPVSPPISTITTGGTYSTTPKRKGSFLRAWLGMSFGAFWLGFTVAMLGMFAFPGLVRLAAPLACPAGYVDAYGERVFNYYHESSKTSVDGAAILVCVRPEGRKFVPAPFFVFGIMFGGAWLAGIILAFDLAVMSRFRLAGCAPALGALFVLAIGVYFYNAWIPSTDGDLFSLIFGRDESTRTTITVEQIVTTVVAPISSPAPTPTPEFAPLVLSFGEGEGDGPGFFDDTRAIAVDGEGNVYTADYSGGRIQVFDAKGVFVNQWKIDGDNIYITGLAADRQGTLYAVYGGNIYRFDGATGDSLGRVEYDVFYVRDVAVSPFGELVAVGGDMVAVFDRDGSLAMSAPVPLENSGAENVAIDGSGNIYLAAVSRDAVLKLSPEGKLLDQIGPKGDGPGRLKSPTAIAVDGQGNIYVNDFDGIEIFDEGGAYLATLPVEGYGFDMVISDQGGLYYMDRNANRVLKFDLTP